MAVGTFFLTLKKGYFFLGGTNRLVARPLRKELFLRLPLTREDRSKIRFPSQIKLILRNTIVGRLYQIIGVTKKKTPIVCVFLALNMFFFRGGDRKEGNNTDDQP